MSRKRPPRREAEDLLAPTNFTGAVRRAWKLLRLSFGAMWAPFVAASLATQIPTALVTAFADARLNATAYFLFLLTDTLVFHAVMTPVVAISSVVMLDRVTGADTGFSAAWRRIRPRSGHLAAAALYATMLSMLGTMLLLPFGPVFFITARLAFLGPPVLVQAIAYEGRPLQDAVPRARALWRGQLMRIVVYMASGALAVTLFLIIFSIAAAVTVVSWIAEGAAVVVVGELALGIFLGVLIPLAAALATAIYVDLRARSDDGLDIEKLRASAADDQ